MSTLGVVVGNSKPHSRTFDLAQAVATAAAGAVGLSGAERVTVDLAEVGPMLFDWSSTEVRAAVDAIRRCSLAVVASPTYKASYTGLLKSFLDWFSTTDAVNLNGAPLPLTDAPSSSATVGG
jgi:FMN reductase